MAISGTVTHLRFVEELDRDADRGGELAHFDCVTANEDGKRLTKVENKPESFPRAKKRHESKQWVIVGRWWDSDEVGVSGG